MRLLNIILMSYVGAFVVIMALAMGLESLLGRDMAMYIVIPVGLLIGMSARRISEKILGYTVLEAMKDGRDDSSN